MKNEPRRWVFFHDNHGATKAEGPETGGALEVVEALAYDELSLKFDKYLHRSIKMESIIRNYGKKEPLLACKAQCEKLASELKTIYKILDDKIAPIPCEGSVYHLADEEFVLVLHCRNNAEEALAEYEAWKNGQA